ncbi:MAG: lipid A deacylase LpxR family protein [Verrucomicrobiota bacterium]|jgi:hypothetical protein
MRSIPLIAFMAAVKLGAQTLSPVWNLPIPLPHQGTVLSLVEENDKFAPTNKDRYYTQGLRLSFNTDENHYWALTQEINTPSDTNNPHPLDTDLPYSGALYLAYGYGTILERGGRRDCLFTAEFQFGVVGPASGAQNVQDKFHDLVGITHPAGWDTQLPNEPAINLNLEFKRRFDLDGGKQNLRDLIARGQLQLGTLRTEVVLGVQYRWGWDLDRSWGHGTIRHSNAYQPVEGFNLPTDGPGISSWFFLDAQTEVVVRNYATDGTNFVNSGSVTRRPLVLQLSAGTTFHFYQLSGTYFLSLRTKDFETQADWHCFGGLKADIKF